MFVKKYTEAVLVANEAASLEINTDKMEYIFMPPQQNERQHCNLNMTIKSIKIRRISNIWE
jgi:hypothetical protein